MRPKTKFNNGNHTRITNKKTHAWHVHLHLILTSLRLRLANIPQVYLQIMYVGILLLLLLYVCVVRVCDIR